MCSHWKHWLFVGMGLKLKERVTHHVHVQLVTFMLMKNIYRNCPKHQKQKKTCLTWHHYLNRILVCLVRFCSLKNWTTLLLYCQKLPEIFMLMDINRSRIKKIIQCHQFNVLDLMSNNSEESPIFRFFLMRHKFKAFFKFFIKYMSIKGKPCLVSIHAAFLFI